MIKKINKAQAILVIVFISNSINIIRLWQRGGLTQQDFISLATLQVILILAFYIFRKR
ncbi:MAG: hypothetical protein ACKVH2_04180 [Flavobacteriales bacterium]|jgi:hypothetical protein